MHQREIDRLIWLVLTQQASEEEVVQLEQWRKSDPKHEQLFRKIQQVWSIRTPDKPISASREKGRAIWNAAHPEIPSIQTSNTNRYELIGKAAAVVLIIVSAALAFYLGSNDTQMPLKPTLSHVHKVNPIGQKSKMYLPDGSIVWLNAASSLKYTQPFSDTLRQVELEGEAYFQVVKDVNKPFMVVTGKTQTTVLGTTFNIQSYPSDSLVNISLITGKVSVGDQQGDQTLLEEGQGVRLNTLQNSKETYVVDKEKVLAWQQGVLAFDGESFDEVNLKIHRWYGVDVQVKGTPPADWNLRGTFRQKSLREVMESISFSRNFKYSLVDSTLTLTFDCQK